MRKYGEKNYAVMVTLFNQVCGYHCHSKCSNGSGACVIQKKNTVMGNFLNNLEMNMFGVELASIMKNQEIPFFIISCIEFVEAKGLEYEGIYRKSGPMSQINALYASFNKGEHRSLTNPEDPFDITAVTSILKKFFRDMPDPLIPSRYYKDLIEAMKLPLGDERDASIKMIINQIPADNNIVLSYLIHHLAKVQLYAEKNLMTASNLGVVFGPTIMRNQQVDTQLDIADSLLKSCLIEHLILKADSIFHS
ncbi:hypothetical protein HK103_001928 [Boothiomyces macroporosus]|uniref:Rho-GAP domain-containing protein n=1 Tax=Boothiomyces macroporosus TaxID=261099 RepID=A0AAD5UJE4_9FUNG|nr:hypothetical protein HK103_001928 [Boothiomyces macroporosus]